MIKMKGVNRSKEVVNFTEELFNNITKDCEVAVKRSIDWLIYYSRRINIFTMEALEKGKSDKPTLIKYVVFFKNVGGFTGDITAYLDMHKNSVVLVGSFEDGEIFNSGFEDIKDLKEVESKYEKIFKDSQEKGGLKQYGCSFAYDVEA